MACDICGKTGVQLEPLLEPYQTKQIKDICPDCSRIVGNKNSALMTLMQKMRAALLVRFMRERRAKYKKGACDDG